MENFNTTGVEKFNELVKQLETFSVKKRDVAGLNSRKLAMDLKTMLDQLRKDITVKRAEYKKERKEKRAKKKDVDE